MKKGITMLTEFSSGFRMTNKFDEKECRRYVGIVIMCLFIYFATQCMKGFRTKLSCNGNRTATQRYHRPHHVVQAHSDHERKPQG